MGVAERKQSHVLHLGRKLISGELAAAAVATPVAGCASPPPESQAAPLLRCPALLLLLARDCLHVFESGRGTGVSVKGRVANFSLDAYSAAAGTSDDRGVTLRLDFADGSAAELYVRTTRDHGWQAAAVEAILGAGQHRRVRTEASAAATIEADQTF